MRIIAAVAALVCIIPILAKSAPVFSGKLTIANQNITEGCRGHLSHCVIENATFSDQRILSRDQTLSNKRAGNHHSQPLAYSRFRKCNISTGQIGDFIARRIDSSIHRRVMRRIVIVKNDISYIAYQVKCRTPSCVLIINAKRQCLSGDQRAVHSDLSGANPGPICVNGSLPCCADGLPSSSDGEAGENGGGDGTPHGDSTEYNGPQPITPFPFAMMALFGVPAIARGNLFVAVLGYLALVAGSAGLIYDIALWLPPVFGSQ